jgi:uncharacterized protein (DUF362 family)/Pyruvate/2-oxoacid:ferredoxin oxidoreductase delta subunit
MIHPADYTHVGQAVEKAFQLFPLKLNGKKILIKPNVLRGSEAQEGITTHPAVLAAAVKQVESHSPAAIIVGDNPGIFSYGENETSFQKTGLMEAARGYYQNIGNDSQPVDFNPDFLAKVSLSRAVLDADIIISLPKFKTHGLTILTGAIKNSYGFLPGAQKAKLHRAAGSPERFHELIVEVFRLRIPDLFIIDAVVGMEGNGPASPDLRDIGLILASDNAVALDAVMAAMAGLEPDRLRFLQKAKEKGLGDYDLKGIEIIGELNTIPNFKLPPLTGEAILSNAAIQDIMEKRTRLRPQVDPGSCTSCGTCLEHCPVIALSFNEANFPQVDADTCITCFCCQELCPEKAIVLK